MSYSLLGRRFKAVFTPVGWQVVDTVVARDPVAEFGLGSSEYKSARDEAWQRNVREVKNALAYLSLTESERERWQSALRELTADRG